MTDEVRSRATLATVAQAAGVSVATASKALRGYQHVSSQARERVAKAMAELEYARPVDRSHGPRRVVEVVANRVDRPYAMEVLNGITLAAEDADIDIAVSRVRSGNTSNPEYRAGWATRLIDAMRIGAIVITAELDSKSLQGLSDAKLPIVVIDPINLRDPSVTSIGSTNFSGGFAAAEHLIELGHRRLAILAGPTESLSAIARLHGFRAACDAAGLEIPADLIRHCAFDIAPARATAHEWFMLPERPTAILAANDLQAAGVLAAARDDGLMVPSDLSVVGYDDTFLAELLSPPLTCVRQPLQDMGRVALRSVLQLAAGEPLDSHHLELVAQLIVRESTAPPRIH